MKKALALPVLIIVLTLGACTPQVSAPPVSLHETEPVGPVTTQIPSGVSQSETEQPSGQKQYLNSTFGLSFEYPSNWFGPEAYTADQTLRVEVGSDIVYPYGEPSDEPSDVKNSYFIVIQYTKNNQKTYWNDTYQSLVHLQDGESLSSMRSLIIKVRQLELGSFKGFEYISTLSDTAQTDHVYGREVILVDHMSNLLTISGHPNNVEINDGEEWRDVYRMIDETNLTLFHAIVDSIRIE